VTPAKVGRKFYGKTTVAIPDSQRKAWDEQPSEKTWSDMGEARSAIEPVISAIEGLIAKNATMGASEYLAAAEIAMRASNKDVLVGVRFSNQEAVMIGEVSLRQLFMSAIQQARLNAATDPEAQELLTSLMQIGRELAGNPTAHNGPAQPTNSRIARS
jgi:hypothetical protein